MRDNWLSKRIFQGYDDIIAHCCEAWRELTERPWQIMSFGCREWANRF
jgi:putative transposase